MAISLLGRKVGMTRLYNEDGSATAVTVLEMQPNRVSQVKTIESDGYDAVQLTAGAKKASRVNKAQAGHFAKAGVEAGTVTREVRGCFDYDAGSEVTVSVFEEGQSVDVTGTSKGKGYAGVIKRHNFKMQDATHGNSLSHRAPGSIGQNQSPGKVFKGKKMAGRMGGVQKTIQNLEIVRVDKVKGLVLIKGAIPGFPGGDVVIKACER